LVDTLDRFAQQIGVGFHLLDRCIDDGLKSSLHQRRDEAREVDRLQHRGGCARRAIDRAAAAGGRSCASRPSLSTTRLTVSRLSITRLAIALLTIALLAIALLSVSVLTVSAGLSAT